jgi:hypothetical protein|tara:strand:- start:228 stop:491 length:264 start_codon:yes stop_codon:yes gene_type:complete
MKIKITDDEAATVGVTVDSPSEGPNAWGPKIVDLLVKKGVNPAFLQVGDMRCVPVARHPRDKEIFPELDSSIPGMVFIVADELVTEP